MFYHTFEVTKEKAKKGADHDSLSQLSVHLQATRWTQLSSTLRVRYEEARCNDRADNATSKSSSPVKRGFVQEDDAWTDKIMKKHVPLNHTVAFKQHVTNPFVAKYTSTTATTLTSRIIVLIIFTIICWYARHLIICKKQNTRERERRMREEREREERERTERERAERERAEREREEREREERRVREPDFVVYNRALGTLRDVCPQTQRFTY